MAFLAGVSSSGSFGFGLLFPVVATWWMPERMMEEPVGPLYFVWASLTGWGLVALLKGGGRGVFRRIGFALATFSLFWSAFLCFLLRSEAGGLETFAPKITLKMIVSFGFSLSVCGAVWICAWLSECGVQGTARS